jgi:hypothetical protein
MVTNISSAPSEYRDSCTGFATPGGEQDTHHTPAPTARKLYLNSRGASAKSPWSYQRDYDAKILIFLFTHKASTYDNTGFTPANLEFGKDLRLL